jgi:hypothetical protein
MVAALQHNLDIYLLIFANPKVPADIRLICWREANTIVELLFNGGKRP